ncbi:MAG TPA: TonB-dependent receptor [Gemmatimonadaceae bacterium]|nr:TonB-dependent receptor [Gemmatimonadaceae bacterium]
MRAPHAIARPCVIALLSLIAATVHAQDVNASPPGSAAGTTAQSVAPHAPRAPLDRPITLELHDVPLRRALRAIAAAGDVRLVYSDRLVPLDRRVSVRVVRGTVRQALALALDGTTVEARQTEAGGIVLEPRPRSAVPADTGYGVLYGEVIDSATTHPLAGVQVSLRGTALRTITNDSGYYYFRRVPFGPQIVVARLIGYEPIEHVVVVSDKEFTIFDIRMRAHVERMQQVIVTATGPQRRLEVGNDITTIDVDSVMAAAPVRSVTELLETRVPGLDVQHTSGAPGDPARLRLRGISSINRNNDPIVVIDGVRMDISESGSENLAPSAGITTNGSQQYLAPSRLDQIDPNSIETIEVFKGPSAAAMYGPDAANGVIVITTKRARPGPTHWQLTATQGISRLAGSYPVGLYRWGHLWADAGSILCPRTQYNCQQDSLVAFQALDDPRMAPFGTGYESAASLSLNGGTEALQYSFTGSVNRQVGILQLPDVEAERYEKFHGEAAPGWMRRPDNLTSWSGTSRLTARLSPTATVDLISTLTAENQQRSSLESAIGSLEGTWVDRSQLGEEPLIGEFYERARSRGLTFTNVASLNWRARSWLPITANVGLNVANRDDQTLLPSGMRFGSLDSTGHFGAGSGHVLTKSANIGTNIVTPLPHGMRITTSLGMNLAVTSSNAQVAQTYGVPKGVEETSVFTEGASETSSDVTTLGWYLAPSFMLSPRFFLSTGFRLDGGSTSGTHATFNGFPKLGVSWLISDEKFFPFKSLFNTLRVRLAYGHAGVQPGLTDRLRMYTEYSFTPVGGGGLFDGVRLTSIGNTELRPERSTEIEGGFDADFLDDRVSVSYTGYSKTRKDAIVSIPVAPSVNGGGSYLANIGVVSNKGAEVTLGVEPLRSSLLSWRVNVNFSTDANELVRLAPNLDPITFGDGTRIVPGYPLFGRWAKPVVGWSDGNHDGIIDTSEVILGDSLAYLGQPLPKYHASLATTVGLFDGRVTVNATFDYQNGMTQFNQGAHDAFLHAANDPNASLAEQAAVAALDKTPYGLIQTVDALRFNDLSVSVAMPAGVARAFRARSMSVALQGSNLGLHTNYHGIDPNVNAFSSGETVLDAGQLPQPRTWSLSVRLGN